MPIYAYRCERCGHELDALQKITEPALTDCPQCGSAHTELLSQFGSTACKALYRCRECLEPFDYFKCI